MKIPASELILNPDGSVYHLNLLPENISKTIITVGDPERVAMITQYFDKIEFSTHKREFKTETGTYRGKKITVISTGIGTDNIDIVFNELDALVNINLKTREVKPEKQSLNFIRIGTSGAIQKDIPIDSILVTQKAIGFDSLLHYYQAEHIYDKAFAEKLSTHLNLDPQFPKPYVIQSDEGLFQLFEKENNFISGITATNVGFYAPQGRFLRARPFMSHFIERLSSFENKTKITNLEMETSGIYGMARLLGHKAVSLNAILANRTNNTFSKQPEKIVDDLIRLTLNKIATEENL
ncbi:nucleoside phosphorylase [Mesonia sp. K7]|uniref:nucleoside phosphorylase n=1 Tax=Mesonia sp. K7 TaxID=2218606 RepID=UPI000DA9C1F6|nr:nucleoside phosphorylase [Mesonia sp. K7]PZD79195.1 phosphorylase [Mesonia sp. K7]